MRRSPESGLAPAIFPQALTGGAVLRELATWHGFGYAVPRGVPCNVNPSHEHPDRHGAVKRLATTLALLILACVVAAPAASAQSALRGSREKMLRQHSVAESSDYPFLETPADVEQYAELGVLVPVDPSRDLRLGKVSFAVTRPVVRTFVQRLARQYHEACGQPLVVTSLTRPVTEQPENASELSVHPAGMAVDIRSEPRRGCRRWLERTLLSLQDEGVLEVTKERRPAHYHIAVFPQQYAALVERLGGDDAAGAAPFVPGIRATPSAPSATRFASARDTDRETYRVQRGDTLRRIASRHGVTVALLKRVNGLRSSRIAPGQVLTIPVS